MKTRLGLLFATLLALSGCTTSGNNPVRTVEHVDLPRYMGDWHIIANIPYFAEKGKVATIDRYALRPDGKIDNTFVYRKKSLEAPEQQWHAVARVVNPQTNAEWRVKFFGLFSTAYLITDLDPNYQWATIAHPSRKYFWVVARGRTLDESTYQAILQRAAAQGFPIEKVQKVLQPAP